MKMVVATQNQGKIREFARLFAPLNAQVYSINELAPRHFVEETGTTFMQNACLKARAAHQETGLISVADDSGLCVDALNGAPGVYSARYGGEGLTDAQRVEKLLAALKDIADPQARTARFVCAICCVLENGEEIHIEQSCEGLLGFAPVGDGGFGYDPIFMVGEKSFSQISGEEKDKISHRGKAVREFVKRLQDYMQQKGENTSAKQ